MLERGRGSSPEVQQSERMDKVDSSKDLKMHIMNARGRGTCW